MSPTAAEHDNSRDGISGVPQLKANGSNWPVFKMRMTWALDARDLLDHLMGRDTEPTDPLAKWAQGKGPLPFAIEEVKEGEEVAVPAHPPQLTQKDKKIHEQYLLRLKEWRKRMKCNGDTVAKMWDWIVGEFKDKTPLVQSNALKRFQTLCCPDNGNIAKHLDLLGKMIEELSAIGVNVSNKDYSAQILKSVPSQFADYLSGMMNAG
ncbi:hypothetical protein CERSUDRAFT_97016 [Gelatoporia subvermispora B]|uniref:Uncharacterized protein n=1 Tax=Ceriporiopsis subvermispora (strain B) TaxID=914234 RepID=M2R8Q6_CERS8|nr:hypothetical protein CERSUDRAFT_97016 [Gelatoporia subvermispora B]